MHPLELATHLRTAIAVSRSQVGVSRSVRASKRRSSVIAFLLVSLSTACIAQKTTPTSSPAATSSVNAQLPVNWLYGAYIPKGAPLVALNGSERFKLYIRQTYTTPGIYIKTGFFTLHDQVNNTPSAWGDGFSGFTKRLGSNQAFRHAFTRNFITYDRSEQSIRPNIMPFAAAFGAGAIDATWNPNNPSITVKGYQNVFTQAWVGVVTNSIGEFAPDLKKKFSKHKE
jgi:hypothetical protein